MAKGHVCVTFDFDAISVWIARGQLSPTPRSRGQFSAVVIPRLIHILSRRNIPATWFVPGHTALTYPGLVSDISQSGHEIGVHGHAHEDVAAMSEANERAVLEKSIAAIASVIGHAPQGFRAPSWDLSEQTVGLLGEYGFLYDSSMMGHDYAPYFCPKSDFVHDGGVEWGDTTDIVELPVSWTLDDFPYLEHLPTPSGTLPGLRNPEEMFQNWTSDLEYMLRDFEQGVLTVTMHPQVIGRGHRLLQLERWLDHVAEYDVDFVTGSSIAARVVDGTAFGSYRPANL